ncbi:MAG: hypothetical protein HFJ54_07920 [Clostridia bacterium]|nr:hypothetical protein [Clostridia bacterium]
MEQKKSEKEELKAKFDNNNATMADVQAVVEFCKKNIDTMDLRNETDEFLCQMATIHLMKYKIGRFDRSEAIYLTKFFAKYNVNIYEKTGLLSEQVDISVLENEEYEKTKGKSQAVCLDKAEDGQEITYSAKVVEQLMSNDPIKFRRGLQTIVHEVVHATQNSLMSKENLENTSAANIEQGYLMALETVTRRRMPKFYNDNYSYLIKENSAEANGLKMAMQMLRIYQPKVYELFDEKETEETIEAYTRKAQTSDRNLGKGKIRCKRCTYDNGVYS